jgi:chemotaxis protein methyltransferase CheR
MIYFDNPTRIALMRRFYDVLVPGGIFIIGLSETIARGETKFEMVQPSIYRRPEDD